VHGCAKVELVQCRPLLAGGAVQMTDSTGFRSAIINSLWWPVSVPSRQ